MKRRKTEKKQLNFGYIPVFFVGVVLWCEGVLAVGYGGGLNVFDNAYKLIFSIAIALFLVFFLSIVRKQKANFLLGAVFCVLISFIYLMETLLYRSFGYFYPLETVLAMGSQVIGGFAASVIKTVFSGVLYIMLFALPTVVYILWRRGRAIKFGGVFLVPSTVLAAAIVFHCLSFSAVSIARGDEGIMPLYTHDFDFHSATKNFGLLTALRLNVTHSFSEVGSDADCYKIDPCDDISDDEATFSVLYDFAALKEKTSDKSLIALCEYFQNVKPTKRSEFYGLFEGKNLVLVCAEAFSPQVISESLTPTLHKLSSSGVVFKNFYQPSFGESTLGGEYAILFGQVPKKDAGEVGLTMTLAAKNDCSLTLPALFKANGYTADAFHNNSFSYYSRNVTHHKIGFDWYGCGGNSTGEDGWKDFDLGEVLTSSWTRSDCELVDATIDRVCERAMQTKKPFLAYYLTVSGHNNYSYDGNAMSRKNWDLVKDLDCSDRIKAYLACQLELEFALENLIQTLESYGVLNDTVIAVVNDHYPYGLEPTWSGNAGNNYLSELCGSSDKIEYERGAFLLWCADMDRTILVEKPTCGLDVLPTLLGLFGLDYDSRLFVGSDALSDSDGLVFTSNGSFLTDKIIYNPSEKTNSSLLSLPDGYIDSINKKISSKIYFSKLSRQKDFAGFINNN